jgi:hypothetical protein
MPFETRKVRPGLVGMALRAVPKMKPNMGRLRSVSLPSQNHNSRLGFRRIVTPLHVILIAFWRIFLALF